MTGVFPEELSRCHCFLAGCKRKEEFISDATETLTRVIYCSEDKLMKLLVSVHGGPNHVANSVSDTLR
jgi:hypothetical protein